MYSTVSISFKRLGFVYRFVLYEIGACYRTGILLLTQNINPNYSQLGFYAPICHCFYFVRIITDQKTVSCLCVSDSLQFKLNVFTKKAEKVFFIFIKMWIFQIFSLLIMKYTLFSIILVQNVILMLFF